MSKKSSQRQRKQAIVAPTFEATKSPEYRYVYATGVYGGINPGDGSMIFYLNRIEPEAMPGQPGRMRTDRINQELQVEVHMSPREFKSVAQWMTRHVQEYEQRFEEITMELPEAEEGEQPQFRPVS